MKYCSSGAAICKDYIVTGLLALSPNFWHRNNSHGLSRRQLSTRFSSQESAGAPVHSAGEEEECTGDARARASKDAPTPYVRVVFALFVPWGPTATTGPKSLSQPVCARTREC